MSAARVLVVEDDPSVRGLLDILLSSEGYDVVTASDGSAALAEAGARPPALILLDLMMPDLDGARVIEQLGGDPALAAVPVVVVTGRSDAVPGLRATLGDDRVFDKPFAVDELLERVAQITGGAGGSSSSPSAP